MAWLGVIGMWMIEGSYIPQLVRLYRIKDAEDFSPWFPLLNFLGRLCAVIYTVHRGDWVLAFGFLMGMGLRATLLGQVVYYKRRTRLMRAMEQQFEAARQTSAIQEDLAIEDAEVFAKELPLESPVVVGKW